MKKILSALAMVAMLSVSCTPETQPDENDGNNAGAQTPSLELKSSATLEFDAEGGSGVIEYELTNPVEGTDLTASADAADWISDLKVGASSTTFTVNEYTGTDAPRTTKVVVSYGGLSVEVVYCQNKNGIRVPVYYFASH